MRKINQVTMDLDIGEISDSTEDASSAESDNSGEIGNEYTSSSAGSSSSASDNSESSQPSESGSEIRSHTSGSRDHSSDARSRLSDDESEQGNQGNFAHGYRVSRASFDREVEERVNQRMMEEEMERFRNKRQKRLNKKAKGRDTSNRSHQNRSPSARRERGAGKFSLNLNKDKALSSTRYDPRKRQNKSETERSVITDAKGNWSFASEDEIRNPGKNFIVKLINKKWTDGPKPEQFVLSSVVGDRYVDWKQYVENLKMQIKLKGDASQWQKALYVASFTGKDIEGLIQRKKWIPKRPTEGVKYFDVLLKHLSKHFKQYADVDSAHDRLMTAKQRVDEGITQFYDRLMKMARMCGLKAEGHVVRNVLAKGMKESKLKDLVSLTKMSTKRILEVGVNMEVRKEVEAESRLAKVVQEPEVFAVGGNRSFNRSHRFEEQGRLSSVRYKPYDKFSSYNRPNTGGGSLGGYSNRGGYDSRERPRYRDDRERPAGSNANNLQRGSNEERQYGSGGNRCMNCDRNHREDEFCIARGKRCDYCGQKNHIKVCCRSTSGKSINEVTKQRTGEKN